MTDFEESRRIYPRSIVPIEATRHPVPTSRHTRRISALLGELKKRAERGGDAKHVRTINSREIYQPVLVFTRTRGTDGIPSGIRHLERRTKGRGVIKAE